MLKSLIASLACIILLQGCSCFCCRPTEAADIYEEGLLLNDDLVAVRCQDGKLSFRNKTTGKVTIRDFEVDWTTPSPHDSMAVFCSGGKRGYYNVYSGEIAVPAQYRRAWVFGDGLAAVQKNGNIGFINHRGEVVIGFLYPYHGNPLTSFIFEDGHCVVANDEGKCGVIDREGNWLIPAEYDFISAYGEYAIATKEGIARQVGYDGSVINSFVLDDIKELTFTEEAVYETRDGDVRTYDRTIRTGMYAYCIGGRYGLMDGRTCTRLTDPLYKDICAVSRTLFRAYLLDYSSGVILNDKGQVMK